MGNENPLNTTEAVLRGVLDAATEESILLFDREGTVLVANETALRRLGRPAEEVIGHGFRRHVSPDLYLQRLSRIREVFDTGLPLQFEDEREGIRFHHSLCPVKGPGGSVASVAAYSRDVTAQRRTEDALRFSEEQYAKAFATNPAAIALTTFEEGVFLDVNDTWVGMFGYRRDEVLGKSARTMQIWPTREAAQRFVAELEAKEGLRDWEQEFFRRSGDRFVAQLSAQVLRVRGERVIQSTLIDLTDRKRAEEELRKAHVELEARVAERTALLENTVRELREKESLLIEQSRMAAMGEMINNIAHQWRQPLNSLGLLVQRLALFQGEGVLTGELLGAEIAKSMSLIQHMSGTIDDFRNFFRPDKEKVPFTLSEVVQAALKLIDGAFTSLHVEVDLERQCDSVIYGYPSEYSQVVLNILSNAKDAFEARETKGPRVRVKIGRCGGRSVLTIGDNAGGIPDAVISKVFEPHFTTKGTHGTGIGLFMSKNIIEKSMNGTLSVRNVGEGAEFRIEV